MRNTLLILLLFIFCLQGYAQNILTNGSFEGYSLCPSGSAQMTNCNQWRPYTAGTPDYFNACTGNATVDVPNNWFGYEMAAQGQAYAGLIPYDNNNYREYIATTFPALTVNNVYRVSMSVSLADNCAVASNGLGVYFFQNGPATIPTTFFVVPVTPQISYSSYGTITTKNGWQRLTGIFLADSAYTNLVIGNFLTNAQTTTTTLPGSNISFPYYYIDSVVVEAITPIQINFAGTSLCPGATVSVPYTPNTTFNTGNTFSLQLSDATGSFANPVTIGSVTSSTSGAITGTIPYNTPNGTGYRLRIVGSNPVFVSYDNGTDLTVFKPAIAASANSPVCEGNTINLSATATGSSTFDWTGPSFTSTLQNPSISNSTTANGGDYVITATLNGCSAKDTVTVVINPKPVVSSVTNNGPLCEGTNLNLAAQSSGTAYQWSGPTSFSSTQQNPSIGNITMAAQGSYSVTAMLNGCSSAPATTTVVVKPMPAVPVATSNSPVCAGGILHLQAGSTTPGVSYDWTGSNGFTSQLQNPDIDPVPAAASGTYNVSATLNGCTSLPGTTAAVVNTVTYLGAYASPNDTICEGDTFNVVTVPVNGGTNPSFQWYKNNTEIQGATKLKYSTMTAATGDSFYCKMVAYGVCNTPVTLFSDKIGVTTLQVTAGISVTVASVPAQPLPGNPVTFTASITNGGMNPVVQWLRNGQEIVGAVNTIWSASNLYPYDKISVRVRSSDPCPEVTEAVSDSIVVNFPASVQAFSQGGFSIYPNPNKGTFVVTGKANENVQLEITDVQGRNLYHTTIKAANGKINSDVVPAVQLTPGVYLLKLKSEEKHSMMRFVVE